MVRSGGGRILAALTARYRDLDLAEEAFAMACAKAVEKGESVAPTDLAAWLYRVADRCALDALRQRAARSRLAPLETEPDPTPEDVVAADERVIPDERLRLIFVCCHPAVLPDARAALTLRLVCGLSTAEIARAFLVSEPTMAQRLVRAKRKIAEARIPFEVPGPHMWEERLEAVLATLEVAYAKAHEDAASTGPHAGYATETRHLMTMLAELLPTEPDVLALAATVHYAEARRGARLDEMGRMIPLSQQDPARWSRTLIDQGNALLLCAARLEKPCARELQAAIHAVWCTRASLHDSPPWPEVLRLYDLLLAWWDDPIVRTHRAVALSEVAGAKAALADLDALDAKEVDPYVPYHVVRADLLRREGRPMDAVRAYQRALALGVPDAERSFILDAVARLQDPNSDA